MSSAFYIVVRKPYIVLSIGAEALRSAIAPHRKQISMALDTLKYYIVNGDRESKKRIILSFKLSKRIVIEMSRVILHISRLTPSWGIWSSDFTPIRTTYTPRPTHVSPHRSTRRRHRPSASGIGGRAESSAFTGQYIGRGRCGVCTLVLIWSPQPSCFSPSPPPLLERRA